MPMVESRWMSTLWSWVPKAEDMSRRTSMEPRLLFRPESRSEVMSVSADSVDLLVVGYVISWEKITRSRIL